MRRGVLAILMLVVSAAALNDMSFNNTYTSGQVLTHSQLNEDNDSTRLPFNRLNDSLDANFVRFSDLEDGDTLLDSLRVTRMVMQWLTLDTLVGPVDIDSIKGHPYIDTITSAKVTGATVIATSASITTATISKMVRLHLDTNAVSPTDGTLSITGSFLWLTGQATKDTITAFGGVVFTTPGAVVYLYSPSDSILMVDDDADLNLASDFWLTANKVMVLTNLDADTWIEVSRSDN